MADSPASFGKQTNHGSVTSHLGAGEQTQLDRLTGQPSGRQTRRGAIHQSLFGATNESPEGSTSRLRTTNGAPRTRTSVQASNLDRLTGQPSGRQTRHGSADSHFGASELTHRTGSPVTFGRRTNHGAIHQPPSGSKRIIGSASLHFDAKLAVPGRAHQSLRCQTSCGSTSPLVP